MPTVVNGQESEYKAIEIPDSDVPALLGMETLKRMGAILDLRKNKLIIPKQDDHVHIKFQTGTHVIDLEEAPGGYFDTLLTHWNNWKEAARDLGSRQDTVELGCVWAEG